MNYVYTIDPNAEEPIMLIDSCIGYDEESGTGVIAAQFCRELLALDSLGKKVINIWINSPGGLVTEGLQIVNTILKTKAKVDTHNVGMAASIAGPIFLAGRKRVMLDNAVFMMHPVHGGDDSSMEAFTNSIITMLSSRSIMTERKARELMDATTWLNSPECLELGIATEIEKTSDMNIPRKVTGDVKAMHADYAKVLNSILNKEVKPNPNKMKKITNKFNLNENSNEDAILIEIEKLENKARVSAEEVKKAQDEANEAKAKFDTLQAKFDEMKSKYDKYTSDEAAAKCDNLIKDAVKNHKIANDEAIINQYKALAVKDFDGTKNLIDALPATNAKPASLITGAAKAGEKVENGLPALDINNPSLYVATRAALINKANQSKIK